MKKIDLMFMVFMVFIGLTSFSQDRVNRKKINFDTLVSKKISDAIGWSYNIQRGEWVDYKNVISDNLDYKTKYKSLQGGYMMSVYPQNFNTIQTKKIIFNGEQYYVILIDKWNGAYKYPSLKQDWYYYKVIIGYVFTSEEYKKLNNLVGEFSIKPITQCSMNLSDYNEVVLLDLIQTELENKTSTTSNRILPIKVVDNNVRFKVPFYCTGAYNIDEYFEVTKDEFNKIVIN